MKNISSITQTYFITTGNTTKQLSKPQFEKQTGMKTEKFSELFTEIFENRGYFK
jgi:hypothetical protein